MTKWKKIVPVALAVFMCAAFANTTTFASDVAESGDSSVEATVEDANTVQDDVDTEEAAVETQETITTHTYRITYLDQKEGLAHEETYTGSKIEMEPLVEVYNPITQKYTTLTQNTDYVYTYEKNCTNVGIGYVTVTGLGEYADLNKDVLFTIKAVNISKVDVDVSLPATTFPYQGGKAVKPEPTVTYDGRTLELNKDYTVTYSNNYNVGTASYKINGIGNYTGSTSAKVFTITKCSLSNNCYISLSTEKYTYNGKAKKPSVVVKAYNGYGNFTVPRSAYTLAYKNNKNAGYATVVVTAADKENYSGKLTAQFVIQPKKVTLKSVAKSGSNVKLTWTSAPGATKYLVFRKTDGGSYSKHATVTKTNYTDTAVKTGHTYRYYVKAYAKDIPAPGSDAKSIKLKQPVVKGSSITSVSSGGNYIQIRWSRVSGASKYQLYRRRSGGDYIKIYECKNCYSYKDTSASSGVTYYYQIRTTINGDILRSSERSGSRYSKLSAPTGLRLSKVTKSFYASWNSTGAYKYEIWWSTSKSFKTHHFGYTQNCHFQPQTYYCGKGTWYVKVRSLNANGSASSWSSVKAITN